MCIRPLPVPVCERVHSLTLINLRASLCGRDASWWWKNKQSSRFPSAPRCLEVERLTDKSWPAVVRACQSNKSWNTFSPGLSQRRGRRGWGWGWRGGLEALTQPGELNAGEKWTHISVGVREDGYHKEVSECMRSRRFFLIFTAFFFFFFWPLTRSSMPLLDAICSWLQKRAFKLKCVFNISFIESVMIVIPHLGGSCQADFVLALEGCYI